MPPPPTAEAPPPSGGSLSISLYRTLLKNLFKAHQHHGYNIHRTLRSVGLGHLNPISSGLLVLFATQAMAAQVHMNSMAEYNGKANVMEPGELAFSLEMQDQGSRLVRGVETLLKRGEGNGVKNKHLMWAKRGDLNDPNKQKKMEHLMAIAGLLRPFFFFAEPGADATKCAFHLIEAITKQAFPTKANKLNDKFLAADVDLGIPGSGGSGKGGGSTIHLKTRHAANGFSLVPEGVYMEDPSVTADGFAPVRAFGEEDTKSPFLQWGAVLEGMFAAKQHQVLKFNRAAYLRKEKHMVVALDENNDFDDEMMLIDVEEARLEDGSEEGSSSSWWFVERDALSAAHEVVMRLVKGTTPLCNNGKNGEEEVNVAAEAPALLLDPVLLGDSSFTAAPLKTAEDDPNTKPLFDTPLNPLGAGAAMTFGSSPSIIERYVPTTSSQEFFEHFEINADERMKIFSSALTQGEESERKQIALDAVVHHVPTRRVTTHILRVPVPAKLNKSSAKDTNKEAAAAYLRVPIQFESKTAYNGVVSKVLRDEDSGLFKTKEEGGEEVDRHEFTHTMAIRNLYDSAIDEACENLTVKLQILGTRRCVVDPQANMSYEHRGPGFFGRFPVVAAGASTIGTSTAESGGVMTISRFGNYMKESVQVVVHVVDGSNGDGDVDSESAVSMVGDASSSTKSGRPFASVFDLPLNAVQLSPK